MAYIPCTTGTVALYQQDGERLLALVVEAWDDDGVPYIAGATGLIPANARPGFQRLEQATAIVPSPTRQSVKPRRRERPDRPAHREREGV